VRTHQPLRPLTTYLSDSLIIPFLFFIQRPIPSKSYIPLDLDRIYIIPFLFFIQRPIPSKSYIPLDLDRIYIIPLNLS
jgi:hypothetical protein